MSEDTRRAALAAIQAVIEQEQERMYTEATTVADQVWAKRQQMRESDSPDRFGFFGVRVRKRTHGISISWFKFHFYRKSTGGWGVKFVYPRLGKERTRYPLGAFRGARDWELPGIEAAEAQFAQLRAYSGWLSKLGRLLNYHPDARASIAGRRARTEERAAGTADGLELDDDAMVALEEHAGRPVQ